MVINYQIITHSKWVHYFVYSLAYQLIFALGLNVQAGSLCRFLPTHGDQVSMWKQSVTITIVMVIEYWEPPIITWRTGPHAENSPHNSAFICPRAVSRWRISSENKPNFWRLIWYIFYFCPPWTSLHMLVHILLLSILLILKLFTGLCSKDDR